MPALPHPLKRILVAGAASLPALLPGHATQARDLPESSCSWVIRNENGRFSYQMQPGWSLQRAAASPDGITLPDNVVGITCLRNPPILVESDAAVLAGNRSISLGGAGGDLLMISYELIDGRVTHRIVSGSPSGRLTRQIDQGVASVQAIIDAQGN